MAVSRGVSSARVPQPSRPTVTAAAATCDSGTPSTMMPTGSRRCRAGRPAALLTIRAASAAPRRMRDHEQDSLVVHRVHVHHSLSRKSPACSRASARAPARANSSAPVMITPVSAPALRSAAVRTASEPRAVVPCAGTGPAGDHVSSHRRAPRRTPAAIPSYGDTGPTAAQCEATRSSTRPPTAPRPPPAVRPSTAPAPWYRDAPPASGAAAVTVPHGNEVGIVPCAYASRGEEDPSPPLPPEHP